MPPEQKQNVPPVAPPPQSVPPAPSFDNNLYTSAESDAVFGLPPKKKHSKKVIAGLIAIVVLVLAGSAAVLGYFWYQNPDKVAADAVMNAVQSKSTNFSGTFVSKIESNGTTQDLNVIFDGGVAGTKAKANITATVDGRQYSGGIMNDADQLFVKVNNVDAIIEDLALQAGVLGADPDKISKQFEKFVRLVDGKWIKIDADSTNTLTKELEKQRSCYDTSVNGFYADKSQRDEIVAIYKQHPLFAVKDLGGEKIKGVDSMHFELVPQHQNAEAFGQALKTTKLIKALDDCTEDDLAKQVEEAFKPQKNKDDDTKIELWASQWEHQLTQVRLSSKKESSTLTMQPTFNAKVEVTKPTESVPIRTASEEFFRAIGNAYSASLEDFDTPNTSIQ